MPGGDRSHVAHRPAPDAHPPARDLILRVWHVDPLRCPVCQNPLRVIAVIDAPRVVERILRHLGVWHDPQPRPPPHGLPGVLACRPGRGFRGPYRQSEMSRVKAHYL
jgi:hypothetical protein